MKGIYRRPGSANYIVDLRWQGHPRIRLSTGTTLKTRAREMHDTLCRLRALGRHDIIGLLAAGKLRLSDVHESFLRNPMSLTHQTEVAGAPALGILVDEWLAWIREPATLSPRTRRPYAPLTIERYAESWNAFFVVLPKGRTAELGDLTRGFLSAYRVARRRTGVSGSTVNRDLVALQSFLRWVEEERRIELPRLRVPKEREPDGRERWLDVAEIAALAEVTPPFWNVVFTLLLYTGLRIGEAQGLRWSDVRLTDRRLRVTEHSGRRLKTVSSRRDVPIPEPLAELLAAYAAEVSSGPTDPVFVFPYNCRQHAYKAFQRAVKAAKIAPATLHDTRHSYGVHCAQAGVPLPRLQKLLGHASATMTMRYMKHAPEAYFAEDAARVAASMTGIGDHRGSGTLGTKSQLKLA